MKASVALSHEDLKMLLNWYGQASYLRGNDLTSRDDFLQRRLRETSRHLSVVLEAMGAEGTESAEGTKDSGIEISLVRDD
uniref:Uncharacterized protein n=1 Tax=uncultured Thiotrichaceae bacterium TaxID=298394 RepID=A0A6S6U675_9GAMM|nr:MAG: Unknown protein [uncultured Thiotrichaceae bacterium]